MKKMYRFDCGCSFPVRKEFSDPTVLPLLHFNVEEDINWNCRATWEMLGRGLTKGVFQLESPLGRKWTKVLKPENLEHMSALGALLRPGVLRAVDEKGVSMTMKYCLRKNGQEPVEYFHPCLEKILQPTYGILTYQEQSINIAQVVAGFNPQEADELRKAIGKKKADEMVKVEAKFLNGAEKTMVVLKSEAEQLFAWIKKSQRYSFNKCSHKDTILKRPNGGRFGSGLYSLEHMYKIRNDIQYAKSCGQLSLYKKWKLLGNYGKSLSMSADGRIRPNNIIDIQPAGKQKVYKVELENGATISVTLNHKFPTSEGEKKLSELNIGDFLYICDEYEVSDFNKLNRWSDTERNINGTSGKGVKGENNRWFTNGSYTEFKKNNKLIDMVCAICSKKEGEVRLELHHKDGNRHDSSIDNLIRLCTSCHKKQEYSIGRTKRGEKGYPSLLVPLKSITYDGEVDTYDVTMETPNHNFVVDSGIVTCNSHSFSYGVHGYICAYLKQHFPVQFFTGWLRHANGDQDPQNEIKELVNDTKLFDIPVEPPLMLRMNPQADTDGKTIFFGVQDIKGIGEATIKELIPAVTETELKLHKHIGNWSWYEVLTEFSSKIAEGTMEKLISVGAFRYINSNRKLLLEEFKAWAALKPDTEQKWIRNHEPPFTNIREALKAVAPIRSLGGGAFNKNRTEIVLGKLHHLEHPPTPLIDMPYWVVSTEEEFLGISLTHHNVDTCDASAQNTTCKEFLAGKTGDMALAVQIEQVKVNTVKTGKNAGQKMAYIEVSDPSATLTVTVFSEAWTRFSNLLTEKNLVLLQGYRNHWQGNDSFVVKKVFQLV
jgi:hypothetical protein